MAPLLELLHPEGVVLAARVFGRNCPRNAVICPQAVNARGKADLIVIAPDRLESQSGDWLAAVAREAASALAPEGFIYVAAPPAARRILHGALGKAGLVCEVALLQHPGWPEGNVLIPVSHRGIAYAYSRLIPTNPFRRSLVLASLRLPLALRAVREIAPSVGLIFRRPGAPPLASWLFSLPGGLSRQGELILNASWRGRDGAVVLFRFTGEGDEPDAIGKTVLSSAMADNYQREASNLIEIASGAAGDGVSVPLLLSHSFRAGQPVLLETSARGLPARPLLEFGRLKPEALMEQLVAWLTSWHRQTSRSTPFTGKHLDRWWLDPASALSGAFEEGDSYLAWLRDRCRSLLGATAPTVAAHNDLTAMNILLAQNGGDPRDISIIDWEAAANPALPLTDFCYAVVDAVMYAGHMDRREAFDACFVPGGARSAWAAALQERLTQALDLQPVYAEMCFHACWLFHAHQEHLAGGAAERPFFEILTRVARQVLVHATKEAP